MDCDKTEKGSVRWTGWQNIAWCSENISLFRARFSRSNMLLSLALLLGISTAISSLPQPWFGLFFCIFVIVDCFDLSNFYYTVKSFYTLTSTFWSWDLPPRIENRTNKKHCHLLSSSTMVWSSSANIVITNQEARESMKIIIPFPQFSWCQYTSYLSQPSQPTLAGVRDTWGKKGVENDEYDY